MKRLASIIAATAAAAAVAAAISLPAGADSAPDEFATFTSCLRAHGLAIPAGLDPMASKMWLHAHEGSASFQTDIDACDPKPAKSSGPAPEELVACLRDHGLTPPASIDELKPWMAQQTDTAAGKAALSACGVNSHPVSKAPGHGGCGDDKPADAAKAKPSRATVASKQ
jgi:hypothetical protein